MKRKQLLVILFVVVAIMVFVDPLYAGPGGVIAKALFKTWYGKLFLALLTIILLPYIIYIKTIEYFAVRKTKKELLKLGQINRDFGWLNLEKNVIDAFRRVYIAWNNENMEEVSSYVSEWYWRNQQLVFLDQWKRNNQKNICRLGSVGNVKPLYIEISESDNLEGSKIAFMITATVEDYLVNRESGKVIEGAKGFAEEDKIWIMQYKEGKWLLDDIREGFMSLSFAKMENLIPQRWLNPSGNLSSKT